MKLDLQKISIDYETRGKAKFNGHKLIALHGWGVDRRIMTGCLEPLFKRRDNWERVYIDLPGMGKTLGKDWIMTSDHILEIVLDFIHKIAPKQQVVLAGESYGSYLIQAIIDKEPNIVAGALLICPPTIADREKRTLPPRAVLQKDELLLANLKPLELIAIQSSSLVILTKKVWENFKKHILPGKKIANNTMLEQIYKKQYGVSCDLNNLTKKFSKPTLLLAGRQDFIVGYQDAWSIIEKYPHMSFAVLDRAGHNLPFEQERLFRALVNEWLNRVEIQQ